MLTEEIEEGLVGLRESVRSAAVMYEEPVEVGDDTGTFSGNPEPRCCWSRSSNVSLEGKPAVVCDRARVCPTMGEVWEAMLLEAKLLVGLGGPAGRDMGIRRVADAPPGMEKAPVALE